MMQHETPLEYQLLLKATKKIKKRYPTPELIEIIAKASDDPLFTKSAFKKVLNNYKKTGLFPANKPYPSVDKELYYIEVRKKKQV